MVEVFNLYAIVYNYFKLPFIHMLGAGTLLYLNFL